MKFKVSPDAQKKQAEFRRALTVGQVAERAGVAVSTLHFYEAEGLISSWRNAGNQRRYAREVLRLDPAFTLTGLSQGGRVDRRAASPPAARSMRRFLDAARERDPAAVVCPPADAAATLAVAIAAERALETDRAVTVAVG